MEGYTNKIYARTDENKVVTHLFSSVFEQPLDTDILLEEGNEDYHAHVHLKYQLLDIKGRYNYKYDNGLIELTDEEKEKLFPPQKPQKSKEEIQADIINNLGKQLAAEKLERLKNENMLNALGKELAQTKLKAIGGK